MRDFLLYSLIVILVVEVTYLTIPKRKQVKVLAEQTVFIPSPTPSPTVLPTPTLTPSPTIVPTPKPTPIKTPSPIPQPRYTSQQINGFIDRFAGQYGVDPNVLRHMAICESGFNPNAYQSGYAGLFQFGSVTWKNLRIKIGEDPNPDLRYNAEEAVQTAAYAISQGKSALWPNCHA